MSNNNIIVLNTNVTKEIEQFVTENYLFETEKFETWFYLFHKTTKLGIEEFLTSLIQYNAGDYAMMEFYYRELYFFDPIFENIPDTLQSFLKLPNYNSEFEVKDKFLFFKENNQLLQNLEVDLSIIKSEVFKKYPELKIVEPSVFYPEN